MDQTTPLSQRYAVANLGRAEATLYLILYFIFNYIHPKYQDYIDRLAAYDTFTYIETRTKTLEDFWWGKTDQLGVAQFRVTIPDLNARAWLDFICIVMRRSVGWIERSDIHHTDAAIARATHKIKPPAQPSTGRAACAAPTLKPKLFAQNPFVQGMAGVK